MASESEADLSYRQRTVHDTLNDHDSRISSNEKRWLMTKGALAMLAAVKGIDTAVSQIGTLI